MNLNENTEKLQEMLAVVNSLPESSDPTLPAAEEASF